jgi:hypothetical protein
MNNKSVDQLIKENGNLFVAISILIEGLQKASRFGVLYDWDKFRREEQEVEKSRLSGNEGS